MEGNGCAVKLHLAHNVELLAHEGLAASPYEIIYLIDGIGVCQRKHLAPVDELFETLGGQVGAYAVGRRQWIVQLGMCGLECFEAFHHHVIIIIGNSRAVEHIIVVVVLIKFTSQGFDFFFG